jgi:diacylglycerol kinase family enzyme
MARRNRPQVADDWTMPPLSDVVVLLNPNAGGDDGDDFPMRLTGLFAQREVPARIVTITAPEQTAEIVRGAVADGASAVVAGGGDGTINAVASALAGTSVPLGVLALGTLNHFAKDAGIPLDLEPAVQTIADGHVVRVDVGEVNGRIFLNNSSIGIYPDLVVERESLRKNGHAKWAALAIAATRLVRRYRGVTVRITTGNVGRTLRTPFLFVGNNEYAVDGVGLGGRTSLSRGELSAYVAPRLHGRDLPRLLVLALIGRATNTRSLERLIMQRLDVETPGIHRLRVSLDGEVTVMTPPLRYQIRPGALSVIVPRPT